MTTFSCLDEGIRIPLKAGHHRPACETPFQWRFADVPMMAHIECWHGSFVIIQGVGTSIAKKPYICVIFQGIGGSVPHVLTLWIRAGLLCLRTQKYTWSKLCPNCSHSFLVSNDFCCLLITFTNSLDPYQYRQVVRSDLDTEPLTL